MKNIAAARTGLIIGTILIIVTMVLHPAGGSIKLILAQSTMIVTAHSIAILATVFVAFGLYGFMQSLLPHSGFAMLAYMLALMGMFAAAVAAAINGLALPFFLWSFGDEVHQMHDAIDPVIHYGFALNKAMDYIFIGGLVGAVLVNSMIIVVKGVYPKWLAWLGFAACAVLLLYVFVDIDLISLLGFRIFVFSLAGWLGAAGWLMRTPER